MEFGHWVGWGGGHNVYIGYWRPSIWKSIDLHDFGIMNDIDFCDFGNKNK